jgi:hypothetical protein
MSSESQENQSSVKPPLLSSTELYKFCDEFNLSLELEKPFEELDGFIIKVVDNEGFILNESLVEEISEYESVSGTILNKLSQKFPKR